MPGRLHLRRRADALHPPGECVDCGACEPACPVEAIFCQDDAPGQCAQFTTENVRFSGQLGSPALPRPVCCLMTPATSPATSSAADGVVARPAAAPGAAPRNR